MSIELPEAKILAEQINKELRGKQIKSCKVKDSEKLQRIGFMNEDLIAFEKLVGGKIESATSRGNGILVKLNNGMNLILSPEYGGKIFYQTKEKSVPEKFHLKVTFSDDTVLTVRLTSMGGIFALKDADLERSYVFRRDFNSEAPSPLDEAFTFQEFSKLLKDHTRMLKSVLVGKNAVVVGLSNSAFQDIIYRARLHPKRKTSELKNDESRALYDSIKLVLHKRIELKGKDQFYDLYGTQGEYTPAMGPNRKQQPCLECGSHIEKMSVGGGHTYFCPKCQK